MAVSLSCSQGPRSDRRTEGRKEGKEGKEIGRRDWIIRDVGEERGGLLLADLACERAILHVARQLERVPQRGYRRGELWKRGQQRGWIVDGDYRPYSTHCITILGEGEGGGEG